MVGTAATPTAGRRRRAADQRREETVAMLNERGVMSPGALAAHFGVSVMTVHRDLNELQRRGIIAKSHGGVSPQPAGVFEATIAFREGHMVQAKRNVAARASEFVMPGTSVLLDDSTTVSHLVSCLADKVPLTAATNFLGNLRPLSAVEGLSLVGLGGEYDPLGDCFSGLICERDIAALRVDAAFVSAAAVDGGAAYHADERIVAIKQAMITAAAHSYLLVDHTKIGRTALHEIAPLASFDAVIVDADVPPAAVDQMRAAGATVVVAG